MIEVKELELTQDQCEEIIGASEDKVNEILKEGIEEVLAKTLFILILSGIIFINAEEYGMTRDELYFKMKEYNVFGRRYFYPLISTFSTYRGLDSANPDNLPIATQMSNNVICLPMHHALSENEVEYILQIIKK